MKRFLTLLGALGFAGLVSGCLNDRHLGDRTGEAFQKVFQEQARGRRAMPNEGIPAEEAEIAMANMRAVWQRAQSGSPSTPLLPIQAGR
jgi:hypothetical protein